MYQQTNMTPSHHTFITYQSIEQDDVGMSHFLHDVLLSFKVQLVLRVLEILHHLDGHLNLLLPLLQLSRVHDTKITCECERHIVANYYHGNRSTH